MFAKDRFVVHYGDQSQAPSRAELGLPPGKFWGSATLIVCEGGVIVVEPGGAIELYIDGKQVDFKTLKGLGKVTARNHWHAWVDAIVGGPGRKTDGFVQTPFSYAAGIAEAGETGIRTTGNFHGIDIVGIDRDRAAGGEAVGHDVSGAETAHAIGAGGIASDIIPDAFAATVVGQVRKLRGALGADLVEKDVVNIEGGGVHQLLLGHDRDGASEILERGIEAGAREGVGGGVALIAASGDFEWGKGDDFTRG